MISDNSFQNKNSILSNKECWYVPGSVSQEMKSETSSNDRAMAQTSSTTAEGRSCTDPDCKCPAHFLSPLAIGTSPDSGIEFDRWTSAPGE